MRRVSGAVRPRPALLAVPLLLAGCYTHPPVRAGARPAAGANLLVRFAGPRDLPAAMPAGTTIVLRDVREVTGRVLAARGDTLELRVDAIVPAVRLDRESRVRVVLGAADRLAVRRGNPTGTVALGLAAAAGLVVLVASTYSFSMGP